MISRTGLFFAMLVSMAVVMPAQADKLDDIIASGKLRCAIVLDFPPMGSRDEKNQPIGYDVDTCKDLAAALGASPESTTRSRCAFGSGTGTDARSARV